MATTYQSVHSGEYIDTQIASVEQKLPINGTAAAATKLATARTITLSSGVTGSCSFDGSGNVSIVTTVTNNSHTHTWGNISDGGTVSINTTGTITGSKVYGAVWNDYAEYRNQVNEIAPGYCVTSNRDGKVSKTAERLEYCEGVVSDTFGFGIGETDECKTPVALTGRVLVYFHGSADDYNIGDVVCAGPDGKVCKMTREEVREWPDRIVGTVSEFPTYETWGTGNVAVNGRIWIKVK